MADVTRRWPRAQHPAPVSTRRDRAERDAATVRALEAYLRQAADAPRRVDVRL